jgi:CubicO group peptidase (beta-lactamase class C family)
MTTSVELPRQTPESQGIPSAAIAAFVNAMEQSPANELHSFILLRHGVVIAEAWWSPYAPDRPHMLFSLSKSFTSTAIGLAVAERRLSVDDPVISFFPELLPEQISDNLRAMKVRHLLSMSTGHDFDTMPALFMDKENKWIKAFLACPVAHEPGTYFLYNTGASYMLSAIIQKLTGETLLDYLRPRLLEPLEIDTARWEMSPEGICMGGFGLFTKTDAIAKFGQLYLQKGLWNGKQLIFEAWVDEATSCHIPNDRDPNSGVDWRQGYGYQFWRCQHNAYRGDGAFGQYCVVMPEQDAVLAITAGVANMQFVLTAVWDHLLPAMTENPLPEQPQSQETLKQNLNSLAYLPPKGEVTSPMAAQISGNTYMMNSNTLIIRHVATSLTKVGFSFSEKNCTVTFSTSNANYEIVTGLGEWIEGTTALFEPDYPHVVASAIWKTDNTLQVTVRGYETPFVYTLDCKFEGDQLRIDGKVNVSFGPTTYTLTGSLQK